MGDILDLVWVVLSDGENYFNTHTHFTQNDSDKILIKSENEHTQKAQQNWYVNWASDTH